jgi:hypothetical protein
MAKRSKSVPENQPEILKGWKRIAAFLGEPVSVVERWAAEGMPVSKQGRFMTASTDELRAWLNRETGKPVHVVSSETDLTSELKRGVAFARDAKKNQPRDRQ